MSTYKQRIDRPERRHLAFAVANCALNPRFAAVTVGSCGDSWKLRRQLEAAATAGSCDGYDGKCSFYFNCSFFRTTPTNRDLREKAVYFPPRLVMYQKASSCHNLVLFQHESFVFAHGVAALPHLATGTSLTHCALFTFVYILPSELPNGILYIKQYF